MSFLNSQASVNSHQSFSFTQPRWKDSANVALKMISSQFNIASLWQTAKNSAYAERVVENWAWKRTWHQKWVESSRSNPNHAVELGVSVCTKVLGRPTDQRCHPLSTRLRLITDLPHNEPLCCSGWHVHSVPWIWAQYFLRHSHTQCHDGTNIPLLMECVLIRS